MNGYLVLEGGAEFGGRMAEPDLRALELAGGFDSSAIIIPTAAAPDHNDRRAGKNGENWFRSIGARNIHTAPIIDTTSAADPAITKDLRNARLVYLLGGFTHYLGQTLKNSPAWAAVLEAYHSGAVVAGSSAGAMVMCQFYFDPGSGQVVDGLNLVAGALVLPHHNTFGKKWAGHLIQEYPNITLIGIDEQTGMIDDGTNRTWQVYGQGYVTIYRQGQVEVFHTNQAFPL